MQSAVLVAVAARLGASPRQVALAWLLQHSATILLIPGTSSVAHLRENIAATNIKLPADAVDNSTGSALADVGCDSMSVNCPL